MEYYKGYNPVTRTRTKRRHKLHDIGLSPKMEASFDAVKDIAILAAVAAISAIGVDFLFNSFKNKTDATKNFLGLKIGSYEDQLARAGVGIVAAILYKKFVEKGKTSKKIDIATGLALGPSVVSAYGILSNLMNGPSAIVSRETAKAKGVISDLGYIEPINANAFNPAILAGRKMSALGAQKVSREGVFRPQLEPMKQASWGSY